MYPDEPFASRRGRAGMGAWLWRAAGEGGDVGAVDAVAEGEELAFAFEAERRVGGEERFHDVVVFLRFEAAGAVDQCPAGASLAPGGSGAVGGRSI